MAKTYADAFMSRFRQPMRRIAAEMAGEGDKMTKDLAAITQATAVPPSEVMAAVKAPSEHPETIATIRNAGVIDKARRLRVRIIKIAALKDEARKAATKATAEAVVEVTRPVASGAEREAPDVHDLERIAERVTDEYPVPEALEGIDELLE